MLVTGGKLTRWMRVGYWREADSVDARVVTGGKLTRWMRVLLLAGS